MQWSAGWIVFWATPRAGVVHGRQSVQLPLQPGCIRDTDEHGSRTIQGHPVVASSRHSHVSIRNIASVPDFLTVFFGSLALRSGTGLKNAPGAASRTRKVQAPPTHTHPVVWCCFVLLLLPGGSAAEPAWSKHYPTRAETRCKPQTSPARTWTPRPPVPTE